MRQGSHFPGHSAREQRNTSISTLKERRRTCQKGRTGYRTPLDPPKLLDTLQERWTPSGTIRTPQEAQVRLKVRIENPPETAELLDGEIFKCIRHPENHQDSSHKAARQRDPQELSIPLERFSRSDTTEKLARANIKVVGLRTL